MSFLWASLWIPHRKYPDLNCPPKREKRAFNLILICFNLWSNPVKMGQIGLGALVLWKILQKLWYLSMICRTPGPSDGTPLYRVYCKYFFCNVKKRCHFGHFFEKKKKFQLCKAPVPKIHHILSWDSTWLMVGVFSFDEKKKKKKIICPWLMGPKPMGNFASSSCRPKFTCI